MHVFSIFYTAYRLGEKLGWKDKSPEMRKNGPL